MVAPIDSSRTSRSAPHVHNLFQRNHCSAQVGDVDCFDERCSLGQRRIGVGVGGNAASRIRLSERRPTTATPRSSAPGRRQTSSLERDLGTLHLATRLPPPHACTVLSEACSSRPCNPNAPSSQFSVRLPPRPKTANQITSGSIHRPTMLTVV